MVDRAVLVQLFDDKPVLAVEIEQMKLLDLAMARQRAGVFDDFIVVAERVPHGGGDILSRHADAELLGGLDDGDGVLGEAGHGAEPVGMGGEDAVRGAERLQQVVGEFAGTARQPAPG